MLSLLALAAGYVFGSIDFAVLVGKLKGVDIYSVGSGNPGTSNVLRTMGKGAALAVLVGDLAKGLAAAWLGSVLAGQGADLFSPVSMAAAAGFMAVVGHAYPVFHKFKGGKGVATAFGVLLWLSPVVALILGAVWAIIVKTTKVAAIGSLAVVLAAIPLLVWRGIDRGALWWVGVTLALVVWRHKGNINRMVKGGDAKVVQA